MGKKLTFGFLTNIRPWGHCPKVFAFNHLGYASDDHRTVNIWGSSLINFSGRGPTSECIVKPDIIAPGADIVSCLSTSESISKKRREELNIVSEYYVTMSGTSMATPILSGAVALLLEKEPKLKPNDIKLMLKRSSIKMQYPQNQQGWGQVDIESFLNQEVVHV